MKVPIYKLECPLHIKLGSLYHFNLILDLYSTLGFNLNRQAHLLIDMLVKLLVCCYTLSKVKLRAYKRLIKEMSTFENLSMLVHFETQKAQPQAIQYWIKSGIEYTVKPL